LDDLQNADLGPDPCPISPMEVHYLVIACKEVSQLEGPTVWLGAAQPLAATR
jgi:hypothetical protein